MHSVTIEYVDYFDEDNKTRTEKMYFNINAFELAELSVRVLSDTEETLADYMQKAIKENRNEDAFGILKSLFVVGYGRRIEIEGRSRFIKKPEWILELTPSPEFEAFYLRLQSDTQFATNFWNGLISQELMKRALDVQKSEKMTAPEISGGKRFQDLSIDEMAEFLKAKQAANEVEK